MYKRQVEGVNALIKKHVGHGTKFVRPPYGAGIRDKNVSKYVNAPMAVSYTHLDVYKRQGLYRTSDINSV